MSNNVLRAVLQLCDKYIPKNGKIHPYVLYYGYAKILSMDESTLHVMFEDEDSMKEIDEARRFFDSKDLDAKLVKQGMPVLFANLHADESAEACKSLVDQILDNTVTIPTEALLSQILPQNDPAFRVFSNQSSMEKVFEFQKMLKDGVTPPEITEETENDTESDTAELAAMLEELLPALEELADDSGDDEDEEDGEEDEEKDEAAARARMAELEAAFDRIFGSSTEEEEDEEDEDDSDEGEGGKCSDSDSDSSSAHEAASAFEAAIQELMRSQKSGNPKDDTDTTPFSRREDTASQQRRRQEPQEAAKENAEEEKPRSFTEMSEVYRKLRIDLLDVVKGQDDPVLEFVQGCFQGEILKDNGKRKLPVATFLFVGPPGVGKTLLAQTGADSLNLPCMQFNMSEYTAEQSHEGLIGVAPFYNKAEEGRLVQFVRENPKCVLIFDEIEKAHRNVIQLFLQILDLGCLDNVFRKEKTSFKDAIVIFTSNACREIYENNTGNISRTPKNVILAALRNEVNPTTGVPAFPNAICSRIAAGNLIMFNHLTIRDMTQMVSDNFAKTAEQITKDYGYQVSIDHRLPLLFMFHHGGSMDARIASRQSSKFIKSELFEVSRQMESHREMMDQVEMLRMEMDLDALEADPELKGLFFNSQATEIAVVCDEKDRELFAMPENYHVHFAATADELRELLQDEISLVLVDLMYGLTDSGIRGVSLDDYDSTGIQAFKVLESEGCTVPVYLLEGEQKMTETDRNSFFQRGAAGIVKLTNTTAESIVRRVQQICEEIFMEERGRDFARRGYVLDFNTAQIPEGKTLKIQYHDFKKREALDADSAAKLVSDVDRPQIGFNDVIGAENAKTELQYFIKYLSNPRKFIREGGKPAKGVLLYGPPGTGKTMLARAMAGESDVAFIQTSATEFMSMWYGQSEENVRDLFRKAKQFAPAIIFIDEIDAIGKTRTGDDPHTEAVLNTLLTELDGFKTDVRKPVFVLAATNYQVEGEGGRMCLDPALVRRFDNRICVDLPNEKERIQYLTLAVKQKGFVDIDEQTIKNVATRTPGLSIAILQNVVDLAYRNAGKQNRLPNGDDLQNALEEYNFGEKHEWGEDYYRSVAIHESGHAYLAWKSGEKPSYMTIESRGNFGGYMAHENSEGRPSYSKEDLIWRIRCALGGRAAEEVFFGKAAALNTGASSDLQQATQCAIRMMCDYGMMENQMIALPFNTIVNTPMAGAYLEKANRLLQDEMHETFCIVEAGKEMIQKLADRLVENNHLTGEEILEVLGDVK